MSEIKTILLILSYIIGVLLISIIVFTLIIFLFINLHIVFAIGIIFFAIMMGSLDN